MKLLQHFKDLTVHPKNAEELKGLILQLAIQGKLTKKWRKRHPELVSGSHSAKALLEKIQEEKAQLIKEKKIKKEKTLLEIEENEIPFELPDSWSWCRLGSYIHNFGQKKPDVAFEYIDVASIENDKGVIKNDLALIQANEAPSRARKIIQKGCVIYSTVRPYLLNIAVVNRDFKNEVIASTAFAVLNPLQGCSELYLYHVLRSNLFIEYVESCMKGVAYPAINDSNLLNGIIPIPPLEEQKAIVDIVNQLFAEVEALEQETKARVQLKDNFVTSALQQLTTGDTTAQWAFLQEHFKTFFTEKTGIKKLRESILQLAVQGKLTQHWRSENPVQETADVLLEKIKAEKAQLIKDKKIKKEKPLPEITEDEIPYELPDSWTWCRIDKIADNKKNALKAGPFGSALKKEFYVESGYKIYGQEQVIAGDPTIGDYYIDEDRFHSLKSCEVQSGDILISLVGTVGKVLILPNNIEPGIINPRLIKVSLHNEVDREFFKMFLYSPFVRSFIDDNSQGSTMNIINLKILKQITIPLPPLQEQKAIVAKVNALMGLCDSLEQEIEHNSTQVEQLMQSFLKEVFEGEKQLVE